MSQHLFTTHVPGRVWTTLCLAAACLQLVCLADTASPNLPPGVQDVVKLVKAGLNEEVVLAQIRHVGATYNLNADQIIYLHDQGVAQSEITALLGNSASVAPAGTTVAPVAPPPAAPVLAPAPAPAPATGAYPPTEMVTPVPTAPTVPVAPVAESPGPDSFRAQLAPYGAWMEVPGYGLCWRPSVETADPFWRPYCDQGRWLYTTEGWVWQSDYPWGDVVFHYGRWFRDSLGWAWVPGYDWAPAWVCWRQADAYCGWAPLPPGAVFRPGVGLWFGGHLAVDVDFGLGPEAFTFVTYDHFWDHDFHAFLLPRERIRLVFGRSVIMNGYRVDHGRFVVEGLGRERMAMLTHHDIRVEHVAAREHDFGERGHAGPDHGAARDSRGDRRDR